MDAPSMPQAAPECKPVISDDHLAVLLPDLEPADRKRVLMALYCSGDITADQTAFWFYIYGLGAA